MYKALFFILLSLNCSQATKNKKVTSEEKADVKRMIPFSYSILSKQPLEYSQYNIHNPIQKTLYRNGEPYFMSQTIIDAELGIAMYSFGHQKPDSSATPYLSHDRDYLQVGNVQYMFDKMFQEMLNLEKYNAFEKRLYFLVNACSFSFNDRKYVVAFVNGAHNSNYPNCLTMLFDMTVKEKPELILCEYQASSMVDCFGDFNQDGNLDYAYREQLGNKLICKTLKNGSFEEVKGYYLTIVDSPHEPKIDLNKSKWFFDLKK